MILICLHKDQKNKENDLLYSKIRDMDCKIMILQIGGRIGNQLDFYVSNDENYFLISCFPLLD